MLWYVSRIFRRWTRADVMTEPTAVESLSPIVPLASCQTNQSGLFFAPGFPLVFERSRLPKTPPQPDDPTPMPQDESEGYFSPHSPARSPRDSSTDHLPLLLALLESIPHINSASTSKFISWRSHQLHSSYSTSPTSSSYGAGPMPTVARAQGGGEWEATLSRRIARRREVADGTLKPARPRTRKRRTSRSQERTYHPIFPRSALPDKRITSSLGLTDLVETTFSGVKARWHWGLVAVFAVAVGVGIGFWTGTVRLR